MIPFNRPHCFGKEIEYIQSAINSGKISGDGLFSKKCHEFLEKKFNFKKVLLTTSCTDALEMASILVDIQPGDEVIAPSYTFVSSVNAFVLRGAKIVFVDSSAENPNIDPDKIEELITPRTKAMVVVHYAGIACDMGKITRIAKKHDLFIIEDAAQAVDSFYDGIPLGSIGELGTFSFHETKNLTSGEGGALVVNDERFIKRAEIIREKGTNRSAFFRGEIDKYGWVDIGSSFLPSDILAAFLYGQLENLELIQKRRKDIWQKYFNSLRSLEEKGLVKLPHLPEYATNNGHLFYLVCRSPEERQSLLKYLSENGIMATFHYQALHSSEFYKGKHDGRVLENCERYTNCLIRLPLFYGLKDEELEYIIKNVTAFYSRQ